MPPYSPVTSPHHNLLCAGQHHHGTVSRAQETLWLKLRLAQVAVNPGYYFSWWFWS